MEKNKYNLTKTELLVLRLVVRGLNNVEIAKEMNISFHTAKAHVSSILYKMQAKNKTIIAVRAIKEGMIV